MTVRSCLERSEVEGPFEVARLVSQPRERVFQSLSNLWPKSSANQGVNAPMCSSPAPREAARAKGESGCGIVASVRSKGRAMSATNVRVGRAGKTARGTYSNRRQWSRRRVLRQ
jgi:hypothetical protein